MGKRIRHLEFYGFPDQNIFNGVGNIDLSDIRETNKDQDREIGEISGETMNKADKEEFMELSGKVDSFIESQQAFNDSMVDVISGINDTLNEITDTVNEHDDAISSITQALDELNAFSASTVPQLEKIDEKLDITVADDTYAKKEDVYTKAEADETFLKEHQDISHLALKSDLEAVQDDLEGVHGSIDTINGNLESLHDGLEAVQGEIDSLGDTYATDEELNALDEKVEGYKASTDSAMSAISSSITSVEEEIDELRNSATTANISIDTINNTLDEFEVELSKKVDDTRFVTEMERVYDKIDVLDDKKVDKTTFIALSGDVASLGNAIDQERTDRENADLALSNEIDGVKNDISGITESLSEVNDDIASLRSDLEQEIIDRQNGDIALIGDESTDTLLNNTIWGAKRYAEAQKSLAVSQANMYTDDKFSGLDTLIDNKFDELDTKLSGKAEKTYVDELVAEKKDEILEEVSDMYDGSIQALRDEDANIEAEVEHLKDVVLSGDTKDIYRRINIITTYTGDSAAEYIDSGNGILDVLHREFHQFEDEIGVVANPTLVKTNEYEAAFGHYNASYTSDDASGRTVFSVGIGTGEYDRKNAIEIREDGTIYMWIEGEFMPINDLLGMLAHEKY